MKKNYYLKTLAFITTLFFLNTAFAVQRNQLLLKTGTVTLNENTESFIHTPVNLAEVINNRYYRIIQFNHIPVESQKAALAQMGIHLLSYLPENAYFASLPFNLDRSLIQNKDIRSVVPVLNEYKLSENLLHPNYPAYALSDEDTRIDLVIQYYPDLAPQIILTALQGKNLEIISQYDYSRLLSIRVETSRIPEIASLPFVKWMEIVRPPSTPDDTKARGLHRANALASDYTMGRHYDGTGVNVVLGDDGLIGPHIDFQGRLNNSNATGYGQTHGDMTGGILVGSGNLNPVYRGMATGAFLYNYNIGPYNHLTDMPVTKTTLNVRIASTSYSQGCNEYNADSQSGDQILNQNPELMWVFSCGNNGTGDCGYGAGANWGNITGGYKSGKNVIACGNLNYLDVLETSSSRGPASDGRIKPDICANGIDQMSTNEGNTYQVGGGTSAASPGIAGITAQLYQAYRELNGGADPDACLLKACMLNTTEDLGNAGPDFKHGWGRVNALRAVMTLEENRYFSDTISQSGTHTYTLNVPPFTSKFKVMLYWLDVEGDPAASKALVNDLDLVVTDPSSVVLHPWLLDPTPNSTNLNTPATTGVDNLNNMEQVELNAPANGTYILTVSGTAVPFGPQKYYIVYEIINDEVTVTYPMGGESFVPGETETIRWDSYGPNATIDIDYSDDNGGSWNVITSGLPASQRAFNWIVPATITGQALVRVTRGTVSGESDQTFSIMNVLAANQISIDYACVDSMQISWMALPNATSYQVYRLGANYMDSLTVTASTSLVLSSNYIPTTEEWFCVSAFGQNNARGRKSIAVKKNAGLFNCTVADDAGILSIFPANGTIFSNCDDLTNKIITIDIQNNGTTVLTDIPVNYSINGGTIVSDTFPGPLNPAAHFFFNFATGTDLSAVGSYTLMAWISDTADGNPFNDTIVANLQTIQGTVVTMPWTEDFETFALCDSATNCEVTVCALSNGFLNDVNGTDDDIDWRTHEGSTATANTGPDFDHNPGAIDGNYLYLEASFCFGSVAQLVSPCIDLTNTTNPKLSFWYHMFGNTMGELHIDVYNNSSWTNDVVTPLSGDQGNAWHELTVDLTPHAGNTIKVRFRGITGTNTRSDMAIDDITVTEALAIDGGVTSIDPNNGTAYYSCDDLTNKIVSVTIANVGSTALSNIPVNFQLNNGPVVTETYAGPIAPFGTFLYVFTATADFSIPGIYDLKTWVAIPNDTNNINDTLHASVQTIQTLYTLPWSEDFETFNLCNTASNCGATICPLLNGFFNEPNGSVDDIDWRTNAGDTPSDSTGPSMDWNPGTPTGKYLYTEASNNCFFQRAELISPCIDLTTATNPELSYKFHMYGNTMGELHTDVYSNGNWITDVIVPFSGNYFDNWMPATVNLTPYTGNIIKIRLRGITGSQYQSDMAIDALAIYEQTGINNNQSNSGKIYVAPNPGNGLFNIVMTDLKDKKLNFSVTDMQGRIAYSNSITVESTEFKTKLDLSSLAKGVYTLQAICGGKMYKAKLCIL